MYPVTLIEDILKRQGSPRITRRPNMQQVELDTQPQITTLCQLTRLFCKPRLMFPNQALAARGNSPNILDLMPIRHMMTGYTENIGLRIADTSPARLQPYLRVKYQIIQARVL